MTCHIALRAMFSLTLGLFLSATAHAQLFRTYIAPDGVDGNPCTLAAPCRLLPAALATVIDGGEIWMLGSANYNTGPVNIAKSVTILAVPGALGSVVAIGGNAINIATAGVKVSLRNLVIVPFVGGGGFHGIQMTAGASLTVENCLIANLPETGIVVTGVTSVVVTDTTIRSNRNGLLLQDGARATVTRATISGHISTGIYVGGNVAITTTADIADTTVSNNDQGIRAQSANAGAIVKVSVRDSRAVRNGSHGVTAESLATGSVTLSASNNIISNNNSVGIFTVSPGAKVWASGNTVSDNGTGLNNQGGLLESAGDNAVRNNTTQSSGVITAVAKM